MLGGATSFSSGGYFGTPLAAALPLELTDMYNDANATLDIQRFSPRLTEAGNGHPLTALRFSAADNLAAWKNLPPLEGVNLVPGAKSDATVFGGAPYAKSSG